MVNIDKSCYLVQLNDVAVSNLLQNCDFTIDALKIRMVLDFLLLQNFDCKDPFCQIDKE